MPEINVGDDRPILAHTLLNNDGTPLVLTGATVLPKARFKLTDNVVTLNNSVVEVDFALGTLTFQFHVDDFDGSEFGQIDFWYKVTFGDGDILRTKKKTHTVVQV